ncbi:MAG: response regulator [Oculatellaceae cyanobacterium bins.114]|nr:response regulator [Oculatellaceae cyanobacterium bins.114]
MTKILVIEDQEALREEIIELLNLEKFQVIGAANGQIGLELAQSKQPDLILCDVTMPALDGHQVLLELRKNTLTATIPFIFLTARTDKADLRQGMQLGADDYLTKPFTRKELLAAIAAQLRKQEAIIRKTQQTIDVLRNNITLSLPHELHTPLSAIISLSEVLLEDCDKQPASDTREMIEMIRGAAEQLYGLTQNFLLQAELELIATNPERIAALRRRQTQSIRQAIADPARSVATKHNRETDLQIDLQDGSVAIAEQHLQKIAQEIIDNAFKFSQAGTLVTITTHIKPNEFWLIVSDHGRGMTVEQIASVGAYMQFERRLHEQQGSGLGLSVAKRLTELYGGSVTIKSIPQQQTTVLITLPTKTL